VTDVTSAWATLHLAGPRSRELLARLTQEDLSTEGWPFLTAREIDVGWAPAWVLRVSFTGELGWELMVPTEFVTGLHDTIVEAGDDLELRLAGSFAFEAARIERGFRSWGHDIGPLDDPFIAGLGFAVNSDADFVGREALERIRRSTHERWLASVHVPDSVLWHGESLLRDGERVGFLSSATVAPTLGGSAGLAWVRGELRGDWTVEVRAEPVSALVQLEPFYDPRGDRARV
jgi:glycine cleavage system aminomethyltransferase T